nr:adenosylcobinamide-phosphate synthase CbiB [uncultured Roseateles sp.]
MPWLLPAAMGVALVVDRLLGEPPTWAHPVVAMGRWLGLFGERLCAMPPRQAFIGGALAWCVGALLSAGLALGLETLLFQWLQPWQSGGRALLMALALGLLLKPLLAWSMLGDEVAAVETAQAGGIAAARQQLARLVSRDTSALDETAVREAAIETLAENLNDSVVAPLFWFAIAGLPGAALYRFANTADAMWGYRDHREWSGKFAARADDVLSWIPARLTALALLGLRPALLMKLQAEAPRTPSPNSGWPMAAMALRLEVRLAKPGVYSLNDGGRSPASADLHQALRLARRAMLGCALLLAFMALCLRLPT